MVGLIVALVAGGVVVAGLVAARNTRMRVYEDAFRSFGAMPERSRGGVHGRVHGIPMHYTVYAGRNRTTYTVCRAALPPARSPFEMDLRPETASELRAVEKGRAIDLVLGDEGFDDSFVVEAAPSEVARALLDERSRTGLLAFHPCRMTVLGDELLFKKSSSLNELAEVKRVLELCAHVGGRLETVPSLLHEARLTQSHEGELGGYRGPSALAIRGLGQTSEMAAEIEALHRIRQRRTVVATVQAIAIAMLAIVAGYLLSSHAHH
jgi:hypothetical protein